MPSPPAVPLTSLCVCLSSTVPKGTLGNGEGSVFTLPGTHLSWFIPLMTVTFFPISRPHLCYQHLYSLLLSSSLSIASCLSCTDCHLLLSYAAAPPRAPPRATHSGVMNLLLNHNTLPLQSCHRSYVVHISFCCSVWYFVD